MRFLGGGLTALVAVNLAACGAIIPSLPPDFALPVNEILGQTACELQQAFRDLNKPEFQRFKASKWLVTVSLTPKVNTNANIAGGLTRKFPRTNTSRFSTLNVSGPGIQIDAKGERTSGVSFTFKSAALMADKKIKCPPDSPSLHALAQHLGVGEWLYRTASAMKVAPSAEIDKPTYNTDITIKFAANGSYTYTMPIGTDLLNFGGSYTLDEQLNISMVPVVERKTLNVVTLPARPDAQPVFSSVEVQAAQQRLDTIQLEQAIRNLQAR